MRKHSLTHQTLSGIFWQSTSAGASVVIRALVLILLARHLSARDFGVVAAAMVVANVTQIIAQSGVTKALVQRLTLTDDHFRAGFAVSLYAGLAGGAVLLVGARLFASATGIADVEPIVRLFSLLIPLNGIAAVPIAVLQRERRFRLSSALDLIAFTIGYGAVGLALTFAGFGMWALATAQVCQVLLRTVLYLFAVRAPIGFWPQRAALADLYRLGSGFSAGKMGNLVATQVDNFIVGRLLGAVSLGLYSRAYQFLMLPAQLVGTASQTVLFSSVASIQDQPERIARAFLRATGVIAMATLPLSGVLIVLAPELVVVTLGQRWHAMVLPFQILIATLTFRTSPKISDAISLALGSMYQRAVRQWVYALAVAAGALAGTPWGIAGVSIGVGLAVLLNFLLMTQLALRLTGVSARTVLAVHVHHALAAVPIVTGVALAVVAARAESLSAMAVLATGCLSGSAVFLMMWWRLRWIFGADGEWAHAIAASRMPLRFRSSGS